MSVRSTNILIAEVYVLIVAGGCFSLIKNVTNNVNLSSQRSGIISSLMTNSLKLHQALWSVSWVESAKL